MYIETTTVSGDAPDAKDPYSRRRTPPTQLVTDEGVYTPGWFFGFPNSPNWQQSKAPQRRLQYWIHLHCETDTFYVSANIAHMGAVGNVSIFFINKKTLETVHRSEKRWLWRNRIKQTGGCGMIWDPDSGSSISQDRHGNIECNIRVEDIHIQGTASPYMGPPFVQSTPYQRGYGCLQWWGPLRFHGGDVVCNGERHIITEHAIGGFDRTIGHRPRRQKWNWLCTHGQARNACGETRPFALQMAKDKPDTESKRDPKKFNLWFMNRLFKFDTCTFEQRRAWHIRAQGIHGAERLDVRLDPIWSRLEQQGHPSLIGGRFNQHFGPLTGVLKVMGNEYDVHAPFALLEDSNLSL